MAYTDKLKSGFDGCLDVHADDKNPLPLDTLFDNIAADTQIYLYDCQRGDCGICQTTVISGTPDHRDVVLSDQEKAAGNVMQICVSRAKSERLVLEL